MTVQKSVADLKPGQKGVITGLREDELALKLLEMGCLPGEEVEMRHLAPFGDPLCIQVSGYLLSLRKSEAETILINDRRNEG